MVTSTLTIWHILLCSAYYFIVIPLSTCAFLIIPISSSSRSHLPQVHPPWSPHPDIPVGRYACYQISLSLEEMYATAIRVRKIKSLVCLLDFAMPIDFSSIFFGVLLLQGIRALYNINLQTTLSVLEPSLPSQKTLYTYLSSVPFSTLSCAVQLKLKFLLPSYLFSNEWCLAGGFLAPWYIQSVGLSIPYFSRYIIVTVAEVQTSVFAMLQKWEWRCLMCFWVGCFYSLLKIIPCIWSQ